MGSPGRDHLARVGNGASLGVSRRIGYTDNGLSLNDSSSGLIELQHMRLSIEQWHAAGTAARSHCTA